MSLFVPEVFLAEEIVAEEQEAAARKRAKMRANIDGARDGAV